jgi:flagella basal body P-ring formation protein FlgA
MRKLDRRIWVLVVGLLVLLPACQSGEGQPTGVVEILPTRLLIPSPTRTPRPTATRRVTPVPMPTFTPYKSPTPDPDHLPTATPVPMVELVVAVQPIPAGQPIPADAVCLYAWPETAAPYTAVTDLDAVIGKVAMVDLFCFEPVLEETLAQRTSGYLVAPLPGRCRPLPLLHPPIRYVNVVVATRYIPAGATISPNAVALRPWPEVLLPMDALTGFAGAIGQVAEVAILREQPLRIGMLRE